MTQSIRIDIDTGGKSYKTGNSTSKFASERWGESTVTREWENGRRAASNRTRYLHSELILVSPLVHIVIWVDESLDVYLLPDGVS